MRILIVNTVLLNGGDAAITQALVDLLRAEFGAGTEFVFHESQPKVAARYYPEFRPQPRAHVVVARPYRPTTLRGRLRRRANLARFRAALALWARGLRGLARRAMTANERRLVNDFATADLVVTTGGTYLVEHYDFTSRVFALEVARRLGRPVVFFTQSLGPFAKPESRRLVAPEADYARLVLLRDERSRGHLREIGVRDDHLRVTADVVFAMADAPALAAARARGAFPSAGAGGADGAGPRVAVSVRSWDHFKTMSAEAGMAAYTAAMRRAVTWLVERHGARVTFLSTCQGVPEYFTDDARTAAEIAAGLPERVRAAVEVDAGFHRPAELREKLRGFDLVLTTRMHMAILGLGVGTLVFPVAYEFKTRELFNRLGLGEYVHDLEGVDAEEFVRTLERFLDDAPRVNDVMFAGVERERERALESGRMTRLALEGVLPAAG